MNCSQPEFSCGIILFSQMAASDGSDDWGGEYGGDLSDTDEDEEWGEPAPPPPSMGLGYSSYKMADDDGERSVTPIRSVNVSVTKVEYIVNPSKPTP